MRAFFFILVLMSFLTASAFESGTWIQENKGLFYDDIWHSKTVEVENTKVKIIQQFYEGKESKVPLVEVLNEGVILLEQKFYSDLVYYIDIQLVKRELNWISNLKNGLPPLGIEKCAKKNSKVDLFLVKNCGPHASRLSSKKLFLTFLKNGNLIYINKFFPLPTSSKERHGHVSIFALKKQ